MGFKVGIDPKLETLSAATGTGRVFAHLLSGLRAHVEFVYEQPDVWIVNGHAPYVEHHEPVVAMVHEASWFNPMVRPVLPAALLKWIEPNTEQNVRAATSVVVPSHSSLCEVVTHYGHRDVRYVPYGVDLDVFRPSSLSEKYVLFVGTTHKRKNLPALQGAMALLAQRGYPHKLGLVLTDGLGVKSDDLDRLPNPDDAGLASLMAGAAALCLPSHWEGFGFPALEAMACGTPVVVSNRGSLPELVGDVGVVVEPEAERIAAGLGQVLDCRPCPGPLRARAERFPWSRTVDGWLEVLHSVV